MSRRRFPVTAFAAIALVLTGEAPRSGSIEAAPQRPAQVVLPARVEAVYRSLDARYREKNALDLVVFMDQFWRVAGNPGFDAGARISNFNDGFTGKGPDVGAHEAGTPVMEFGVKAYLDAAAKPGGR